MSHGPRVYLARGMTRSLARFCLCGICIIRSDLSFIYNFCIGGDGTRKYSRMAIPLDYSSSEGEEIPNENHGNGTAEYSQISDYELISADDRLQAGPNSSNGNGQAAQGFQAINSQEGEGSNPPNGSSSTTVVYNGMEIHVFGNVGGFADLQVGNSSVNENDSDGPEKDEEAEEEERRREEAEIAIREANMADLERRRAPLNPERRAAIINAMRGITLEGFRPDWADTVPENQWVDILRRPQESPSQR